MNPRDLQLGEKSGNHVDVGDFFDVDNVDEKGPSDPGGPEQQIHSVGSAVNRVLPRAPENPDGTIEQENFVEQGRRGAENAELVEAQKPPRELPAPEQNRAAPLTLSAEMLPALEEKLEAFRQAHPVTPGFLIRSVTKGNPTAIQYGGTITNYSTITGIETLPDGQEVFVIYNYPFSFIHRWLDKLMKWASQTKVAKASNKDWPRTFGDRSNIPLLYNNDADTVVLPFIPNVNAYDLFAHNGEITDWGVCEWAGDVDPEKKLEIFRAIVQKLAAVHEKDVTWGETILPNIIVDQYQEPHICDPETRYYEGVPLVEQKARDLRDIFMSVCGALKKADSFDDFKRVLGVLRETYPDRKVLDFLHQELSGDLSFMEHLFYGYTAVRLGISKKDYMKALEVLRKP